MFSNTVCPNEEISCSLNIPTPSVDFYPPSMLMAHFERAVHHFHTPIGHRVQILTPLRIFGRCWIRLCTVTTLSHHHKICVEKLMEHWWEIKRLTLQKLTETMPLQKICCYKAKGCVTEYYSVWHFFLWWPFVWSSGIFLQNLIIIFLRRATAGKTYSFPF